MKPAVLAFVAALLATPAWAETACPPDKGSEIPLFEDAKAAFLRGDYKSFDGQIGVVIKTDYEKLFHPLVTGMPDGFEDCTTIVQRVDTGGMVQEVVLYRLPGGTPLGVYLMAAPLHGQFVFLSFSFSSDIGDVLNELH